MRAILLAGLVSLVVSCTGVVGQPAPSEAERAAYDAATGEVDPATRRAALARFVTEFPDGALEPDARLRLGELAAADGEADAALFQWETVIRTAPRSRIADVARVRAGSLEWERGNAEAARTLLSKLRFDQLAPGDRRIAYRVLALGASDPVAKVRWLALARGDAPDAAATDAIDAEIDAALEGMDAESLARLSRQLGERPPAAQVWLSRAELALDAGELDDAKSALERAGALPLPPRHAARLASAASRLQLHSEGPSDVAELPTFTTLAGTPPPSTAGAAGAIGVVLPLSGPFARFGEESLNGVLLAAGVFGPAGDPDAGPSAAPGSEAGAGAGTEAGAGSAPPALRVLVRDSAGDPARAAQAVRELAEEAELAAIVGPLVSAEELGVPLLTLTSREEIAHLRHFVFRLRTRPIEEAQLLAERARADGALRFAILYRDDPYGRGLRGLFWDAVEARGGRVTAVAPFDPEATDFAEPIRRLVGYTLMSDEEKRLVGQREAMLDRARRLPTAEARALRQQARSLASADGSPIPPIVDFDALFIAESYENVVLIAPQLAFHEVVGARLLGPDGWYHPDLVRLGGEHVEGAVFVAHFFPDSATPFVRDFADRYRATFAQVSSVFAAQAYDAANLVLVQLARGLDSRQAVRDGVLATEDYPGVAGVTSMRSDGNAKKRPFLLGVENGQIVQLD
jgi:ABC-type branched-subunit amino acid transport system substrate-binding protein/predicted negative regulator of RcsB-dependent stress response